MVGTEQLISTILSTVRRWKCNQRTRQAEEGGLDGATHAQQAAAGPANFGSADLDAARFRSWLAMTSLLGPSWASDRQIGWSNDLIDRSSCPVLPRRFLSPYKNGGDFWCFGKRKVAKCGMLHDGIKSRASCIIGSAVVGVTCRNPGHDGGCVVRRHPSFKRWRGGEGKGGGTQPQ